MYNPLRFKFLCTTLSRLSSSVQPSHVLVPMCHARQGFKFLCLSLSSSCQVYQTSLILFRHQMRSGDLLTYLFLNHPPSDIVSCPTPSVSSLKDVIRVRRTVATGGHRSIITMSKNHLHRHGSSYRKQAPITFPMNSNLVKRRQEGLGT